MGYFEFLNYVKQRQMELVFIYRMACRNNFKVSGLKKT